MALTLRLVLIGLLMACLLAPRPVRTVLPMRPALSHEDAIDNRLLAPPEPPAWTAFHPWPLSQKTNPHFEMLRQSHKAQIDRVNIQQDVLLEHSVLLAQQLPDDHLIHAVLSSGEYDCLLGNCQIWIQLNP